MKEKESYSRLKNMMGGAELPQSGSRLLKNDLTAVLSDYFDVAGELSVKAERKGRTYAVTIECEASGIKPVMILPESGI